MFIADWKRKYLISGLKKHIANLNVALTNSSLTLLERNMLLADLHNAQFDLDLAEGNTQWQK